MDQIISKVHSGKSVFLLISERGQWFVSGSSDHPRVGAEALTGAVGPLVWDDGRGEAEGPGHQLGGARGFLVCGADLAGTRGEAPCVCGVLVVAGISVC